MTVMLYPYAEATDTFVTLADIQTKRDALWATARVPIDASATAGTFYMACDAATISEFNDNAMLVDSWGANMDVSVYAYATSTATRKTLFTVPRDELDAVVIQYRRRRYLLRDQLFRHCAALERCLPWVKLSEIATDQWPLATPANDKRRIDPTFPEGTPQPEYFPTIRQGSDLTVLAADPVEITTTASGWRSLLGGLPIREPTIFVLGAVSSFGGATHHGDVSIVTQIAEFDNDGTRLRSQGGLGIHLTLSPGAEDFVGLSAVGFEMYELPAAPATTDVVYFAFDPANVNMYYAVDGDTTWTELWVGQETPPQLSQYTFYLGCSVKNTAPLSFPVSWDASNLPGGTATIDGVEYRVCHAAPDTVANVMATSVLFDPDGGGITGYEPGMGATPSGYENSPWVPHGTAPAGGTSGQVLEKASGDDYDYTWSTDNT